MHLGCMHYANRRTARGSCGAELLVRDGDGVGDMCLRHSGGGECDHLLVLELLLLGVGLVHLIPMPVGRRWHAARRCNHEGRGASQLGRARLERRLAREDTAALPTARAAPAGAEPTATPAAQLLLPAL